MGERASALIGLMGEEGNSRRLPITALLAALPLRHQPFVAGLTAADAVSLFVMLNAIAEKEPLRHRAAHLEGEALAYLQLAIALDPDAERHWPSSSRAA